MTPPTGGPRRHLASSPFNKQRDAVAPADVYAVDDRVTHDTYGLGRVTGVANETAVYIDFGSRSERVALPCRKLFKL